MSRTVYFTATSLDGFIADEHDSLDWLFVQRTDDDGQLAYPAFIETVGAMVMGATTYAWIQDRMAAEELSDDNAWPYDQPSWVLTHRSFESIPGADLRFVSGDVAAVYADLVAAAGERDVWVVGGGDLVGQFADAGLLHTVIVQIAPVTLGAGRPLLPRRLALELVETARNVDFVAARYDVRGLLEV